MARELTTKQRRFVEAYAGNGVEAARIAGYAGSDNVLRVTASRLLTNANVLAGIQARQEVEEQPPDCRPPAPTTILDGNHAGRRRGHAGTFASVRVVGVARDQIEPQQKTATSIAARTVERFLSTPSNAEGG